MKKQSKVKIPRPPSKLEETFALQLKAHQIRFVREVMLIPDRKWRVDFFIDPGIVIELEGGAHSNGRHVRGAGFESDCEKYAALAIAGYVVLRATMKHVQSGQLLNWVKELGV